MEPIRSRPGDPPPKAPKAQAPIRTADGYTVRPAAALVVTEAHIHDRPRIYKRRGIWHCMGHGVVSDGYDPKHAYDEWRALVRKRQRAELEGA
jgi:hypothetical protein